MCVARAKRSPRYPTSPRPKRPASWAEHHLGDSLASTQRGGAGGDGVERTRSDTDCPGAQVRRVAERRTWVERSTPASTQGPHGASEIHFRHPLCHFHPHRRSRPHLAAASLSFVLSIAPSTTASPSLTFDRVCSAAVGPFEWIYSWRLGGGRCWVRNDGQTEDEKDAPGKAGRSPMPASEIGRAHV